MGVGGQRLPSSVSGHASSSVPSDVLWAPTTGAPRVGRIGGSPDLAHPLAASLMLFVTQQGSQGNFTVWGRGFRDIVTSLERNTSSSSLSDLASALGPPFFLFPHPEAKWSPGQSTKWLFATKHLQKPEGGSWPICQSRLPHSHSVTHTALRRLCQQAWPKWAQLLSLHLQKVKGGNTWLLQKQAEGEKLAAGALARPGERSGRKAGKGFPGL